MRYKSTPENLIKKKMIEKMSKHIEEMTNS